MRAYLHHFSGAAALILLLAVGCGGDEEEPSGSATGDRSAKTAPRTDERGAQRADQPGAEDDAGRRDARRDKRERSSGEKARGDEARNQTRTGSPEGRGGRRPGRRGPIPGGRVDEKLPPFRQRGAANRREDRCFQKARRARSVDDYIARAARCLRSSPGAVRRRALERCLAGARRTRNPGRVRAGCRQLFGESPRE